MSGRQSESKTSYCTSKTLEFYSNDHARSWIAYFYLLKDDKRFLHQKEMFLEACSY